MGITMTVYDIRAKGGPFFFDQNEFLFENMLGAIAFVGLVAAAIALRRRTDWHRRLMYCSMAMVLGPGVGRLLPSPLLIPWAYWIVQFFVPMLFPLIGVWFDLRTSGRVHRAWLVGIGVAFATMLVGDVIAYSPAGIAVTKQLVAGTPGADRAMKAFLPS
jgi:hypothetical protein